MGYFDPAWYWHQLGLVHFAAGRYDEAIEAYEHSATRPGWMFAYITACHVYAGRPDQARRAAAEALRLRPNFSIQRCLSREPFKNDADSLHLADGLRMAGLPE
jgi:tetratricopeptide (TPR) repeat protein